MISTLPVSRLGRLFIHYSSHLYTAIPPDLFTLVKEESLYSSLPIENFENFQKQIHIV